MQLTVNCDQHTVPQEDPRGVTAEAEAYNTPFHDCVLSRREKVRLEEVDEKGDIACCPRYEGCVNFAGSFSTSSLTLDREHVQPAVEVHEHTLQHRDMLMLTHASHCPSQDPCPRRRWISCR